MEQPPEPIIPRVLHRLWIGPDPIPQLFVDYEESWRRLHPTWQLRLWRDETLSELSLPEDLPSGFKRRYDIIRLEILRQCGGVIVDMDVEAVRALDPLLRGVEAFVGRLGRNHIGNQVLGAVPHHRFFERASQRLLTTIHTADSSSDMAGKGFLKHLLAEHPDGVTVFPSETFYFEPSLEPPRRPADFPAVYAVHHSTGSYVGEPDEDQLEHRLQRLRKCIEQMARLGAALESEAVAERFRRLTERLVHAEGRVSAAVRKHDRAHRVRLRRLESELAQAHRSALRGSAKPS